LENKPQALVLVPTRELAIQVKEDVFHIGRFKRIKVAAVYGRAPFSNQERELKQKTHVVVGTPGRVMDHLEKKTLDTSNIKYLIIDEADKMLSMGFLEQIETILNSLTKEHVSVILSATLPKDIETLCSKYLKDATFVEIEEEDRAIDRIHQELYLMEEREKPSFLRDMTILENPDSCIVFCNTKQSVDDVYIELTKKQYLCEKIHGGMEQKDRIKVMNAFREGKFRYLIATDIAARGIDIDEISLVINYDIPRDRENYVHRIGRTGRAGKLGRAISFATYREQRYVKEIEDYIGKDIPRSHRPDVDTIHTAMQGFTDKMNTKPERKELKGKELSKDIKKLHINAGKKDKIRPVDIVGTICSIDGITSEDIGVIHIDDIASFVEILNGKGTKVLKELQKRPMKGKLRKVNKAKN
jgi:superfamily II DNA/RNA helicase